MKRFVVGALVAGLLVVPAASCGSTIFLQSSGNGSGSGSGGGNADAGTDGAASGASGGGNAMASGSTSAGSASTSGIASSSATSSSASSGAGAGGSGGGQSGAGGAGGTSSGNGGAGGGSPVACNTGVCPSPDDVSTFQPTWNPPTAGHQNVCTTALLEAFNNGSLNGVQLTPAQQACADCLTTTDVSAAMWGPIISGPGWIAMNTAGCIALLDPSAMACALSIEAEFECQTAACGAVCPLDGSTSAFDELVTCTAAANQCGCAPWFAATQCQKQLANAGSPAADCFIGQTFEDEYYLIAPVFCGP